MKITYSEAPALYGVYAYLGETDIKGWDKVVKNLLTLKDVQEKSGKRLQMILDKYAKKEGKKMKMENNLPYFGKDKKKAHDAAESLMNEEVDVKLEVLSKADLLDNKKQPVALQGNRIMALHEKKLINKEI